MAALALAAAGVMGPAVAAVAAPPATGTITEGVGMAGAHLGDSRTQVEAAWGAPAACTGTPARTSCGWRSAPGVTSSTALFVNGRSTVLTAFNLAWATAKGGIHNGSTATALAAAYGPALKTPDYYHRQIEGTSGGVATRTSFVVDWWAPWTDQQYFGVTSITVAYV